MLHTAATLRNLCLGQVQAHIEPELSALFGAAAQLQRFVATSTEFSGASLPRMTPQLRELRLRGCGSLLSAPVAALFGALRALVVLEVSRCRSLTTDEPLQALLSNEAIRSTLVELRITDVDFAPPDLEDEDIDLRPIALQNPVYIALEIGPVEIARTIPEIFRNLKILDTVFCGWVTNIFIHHIGEHLHQLEELDVSGCTNIRGQFALEPLGTLPRLRKICFHNMHPSVGAQVLGTISTLEEIRCRDNLGITDEDTTGAVRGCPNLAILDVEGCFEVTQQTVHEITEIVRRQGRMAPLGLWVGGTRADRHARVRGSLVLRVEYDRVYQPLMREFLG